VRVLYFSEVQWLSQVSRKHQMVRRFPGDWEVLFLSPANAKPGENSFRTRRDLDLPNVRYRSLLLPKPDSTIPLARALTEAGAPLGYRGLVAAMLSFRPDVVVTSFIWANAALPRARSLGIPVVYDCNDLHPDFYPTRAEAAERAFRELVGSADEVVTSSVRLKEVCGRGTVIGNGVDTAVFPGRTDAPLPPPIASSALASRKGIVIYVGSVDRRIDFEVLRAVCKAAAGHDLGLVCVGRVYDEVRADADALEQSCPEHVLFTGLIPYRELPAYLSNAPVGIAPFVLDERTRAINPNKLYMYAAMEQNIVSTPFSADVTGYGDVIYIESDPDAFARAVIEAFGNEERRRTVRERIALPNDWNARAREFTELLSRVAERSS